MAKQSLFENGPAGKKFTDALNSLAYRQSLWQVFGDFLDFSLLMLRWWDVKEEMFADLLAKYPDKEQHQLFAEAYFQMGIIAEGDGDPDATKGFIDPFGNYFQEHFSSDRAGQFFTPEHICDMMAIMSVGEGKDGETVCDPCCGSGRMLLSAAKINRKMKFYAADIDLTCCKMTLINFMLNSMPGEVGHMDTLKMEIWKSWKVSLIPYGDHVLPMYIELEPHQSSFKQRMQATFEPKEEQIPIDQVKFKKTKVSTNTIQQSLFS